MNEYGCYGPTDLFEIMYRGLRAKADIMRQYPDLSGFVMKAFYEKDPEVCREIQATAGEYASYKANAALMKIDPDKFIPGLDLEAMYMDMYWASEGYLWEKIQNGRIDVDEMERDFIKMIDFWKKIYLRKEG